MRVRVPDRPGAISGITQALGAEGINIEDFELHHRSTDAGGTIVVVIAGAEQAQRAVELLDDHGYQATSTCGGGTVSEHEHHQEHELRVGPSGGIVGELDVPGDKSVSHRAVMLASLAEETVTVTGFGASADTLATVAAFRQMGVEIDQPDPTTLIVHGVGLRGLQRARWGDRRAERGHADAAPAGDSRRPAGVVRPGRRRQHSQPADGAHRGTAAADGRGTSRPPTAARR